MLDEDDVKVAADALKELEALMPSADRQGKQKNSDHRYAFSSSLREWMLAVNVACLLCGISVWIYFVLFVKGKEKEEEPKPKQGQETKAQISL